MSRLFWIVMVIAAGVVLAVIGLHRGESINAAWLVAAALSVHMIAYRFYSRFVAERVLLLDDHRLTPAFRFEDGLDHVPTNKWVLFGHHFAAIAGAGPLVGPVLAAQMGYLPGTLWILAGVVFAGAVQDMVILFCSTRRDARSLGEMIRQELGPIPGTIAGVGILAIMIILLAVLALVVIKALANSPWGTFTLAATIPIALLMGLYMHIFRPGRILEASVVGVVLLLLSIHYGGKVSVDPYWAQVFTFKGESLAWMLMGYGFIAAVLPVWLLLAPRDYLSTFLKIGTIVALAIGIIVALPPLAMPAVSRFIDGTGPVFAGSLFPFLFITIACGAVSGFHSLVASGTTPKMIELESHIRPIGYGAMLAESFVAMMAMVAASTLEPGIYFAMNSPVAVLGKTAQSAAQAISQWGFLITPEQLTQMAADMGEKTVLSRSGGAPTLAVGMANILSMVTGGAGMKAFWYHFAILFEALFILTTIDAGTRVGRFLIQDLLGAVWRPMANTDNWLAGLTATALCVGGWGYFLYMGVIDPLGGINTLWPLFGIANQMLAGIALLLATTILMKMKRQRFVWVTVVPTFWVLLTTLTAAAEKMWHPDPKIGFFAHAHKFSVAEASGQLLPPAKTMLEMRRIIVNDYVDLILCGIFMAVVIAMLFYASRACYRASRNEHKSDRESEYILAPFFRRQSDADA